MDENSFVSCFGADIYADGNGALAYICGMLSPARFFVEMMVMSEYRLVKFVYI
jgi:hypothetical protein